MAPLSSGSGIEQIPVTVRASSLAAGTALAREIASLIRERAVKGQKAVLGLASGSTPQAVYEELSFTNVVTFNLIQGPVGRAPGAADGSLPETKLLAGTANAEQSNSSRDFRSSKPRRRRTPLHLSMRSHH